MKEVLLFLTFCCVALSLAGCLGSSVDNDQKQRVSVAQQYIAAQKAGDWQKMCSLMSERSQRALRRSFAGSSCSRAIASAPRVVRKNFKDFAASVIKVEPGSRDSIVLETANDSSVLEMIKENGLWRASPV